MRCGLCFRQMLFGSRQARGLSPLCWECAEQPRWLFGWRALSLAAFHAFALGYLAARMLP